MFYFSYCGPGRYICVKFRMDEDSILCNYSSVPQTGNKIRAIHNVMFYNVLSWALAVF